jgi:hypothetical protein
MKTVDYDAFKKLPDGTLYTYDAPDEMIRHAIFEKGVDVPKTSPGFRIYERDDLKKLQEQVEFALGLQPTGRPLEEE